MADIGVDLSRYALGWHDEVDYVFKPKRGLNEDIVKEISGIKNEPQWMLDFRLKSLRHFEKRPMPSLILIDGGIGQLHAAAQALESLQIINQPMASIAKKEEILYILGQEDEPCILDRHSPVLHLIQQIRDETHRFAVSFHRQRRAKRQTKTALSDIPGVGPRTTQKLLREFGSIANLRRAGKEKLSRVVSPKVAEAILTRLEAEVAASNLK